MEQFLCFSFTVSGQNLAVQQILGHKGPYQQRKLCDDMSTTSLLVTREIRNWLRCYVWSMSWIVVSIVCNADRRRRGRPLTLAAVPLCRLLTVDSWSSSRLLCCGSSSNSTTTVASRQTDYRQSLTSVNDSGMRRFGGDRSANVDASIDLFWTFSPIYHVFLVSCLPWWKLLI